MLIGLDKINNKTYFYKTNDCVDYMCIFPLVTFLTLGYEVVWWILANLITLSYCYCKSPLPKCDAISPHRDSSGIISLLVTIIHRDWDSYWFIRLGGKKINRVKYNTLILAHTECHILSRWLVRCRALLFRPLHTPNCIKQLLCFAGWLHYVHCAGACFCCPCGWWGERTTQCLLCLSPWCSVCLPWPSSGI